MAEWLTDNGLLLGLALLDGLAYAALVFMVAVGLNMVFGVLRIVNVAHGSLFAIGAYTAASVGIFFASLGLPAWASYVALLLAAVLVGGILGPLIERLILRRIYGQEEVLQLLVTFALFMILEDVQKLIWGVQPIMQDTPMKFLGTVEVPFGEDTIPFTAYQLFVLPGVAVATLAGLAWFLRRTLTGRVIVAVTTDNRKAVKGADIILLSVKPQAVEEVLQEIRTRLLVGSNPKISSYRGSGALSGWLRSLAVNAAQDRVRSNIVQRGRLRRIAAAERGRPSATTLEDSAEQPFRSDHARVCGRAPLPRGAFRGHACTPRARPGLPARMVGPRRTGDGRGGVRSARGFRSAR